MMTRGFDIGYEPAVELFKMQTQTTWHNITKAEARRIVDGEWPKGKCNACQAVVFEGEPHTYIIRQNRLLLCRNCMFIPKPIVRKLLPERTI